MTQSRIILFVFEKVNYLLLKQEENKANSCKQEHLPRFNGKLINVEIDSSSGWRKISISKFDTFVPNPAGLRFNSVRVGIFTESCYIFILLKVDAYLNNWQIEPLFIWFAIESINT